MPSSRLDVSRASAWLPPASWRRIRTIDAHAAGEPFRIVIDGVGDIPGETILLKRRHAMEHLDHIRRALIFEPRGHADMYGCFLTEPVTPDGDFGILFMHNEGFSTMCGHGVIAVTKAVLETGMLPIDRPETRVRIDSPAGPITAFAELDGDRVASVRFENVVSFVSELDASVDIPGLGEVRYDLAFGGAFYAYVDAAAVSLSLEPSKGAELGAAGRAIKHAVMSGRRIVHPTEEDLGFLYGVIFIGPPTDPAHHSRNVCVFAEGEIDRSPTGTGVSGRVAIHHARGELALGETIAIESIVGTVFEARVDRVVENGVVPVVRGTAHITGRHQFWLDPADRQPPFLVR